MSNVFEAPLRLELRASRHRTGWLIAVHVLMLSTLPWLPSSGVRLLVVALVSVSLLRELHTHARNAARVVTLLWRSDGFWEIGAGSSRDIAVLSGPAFVHPRLVVLPLGKPGRRSRRHIAIFADSLDATAFRRLRVRLRFQAVSNSRTAANLSHSQL